MANEELQRRSRRVRVFWIVAAAVVVIAIVLSMLPDAIEADLAKADRGDVRVEVVDEGRTRMHDIYIVSAPITGRVLRVEVEPGDEVAAGAVVARMSRAAAGFLDTRSDLQARAGVTAAEAQLRSAEAELGARRARAQAQHGAGRGEPDFQGCGRSKRGASRCGAGGSRRCASRGRARSQRLARSFPYRNGAWST